MATASRRVRTTRKRVRPRRAQKGPTKTQIDHAEDALTEVRNVMVEIEALKTDLSDKTAKLEKLMKASKLDKVAIEDAIAEIKAPTQRTATVIDPAKFYEACDTNADFFSAVQVLVTKAKELLSGKEIDAISEKIPGEKKPPTLGVKMVKPKKGK